MSDAPAGAPAEEAAATKNAAAPKKAAAPKNASAPKMAAPPNKAAQAKKAAAEGPVSSEREFRQRLVGALKSGNLREMRALWHDPKLEPHMHLFVLLAMAFGVGILIWIVEPMLI